MQEGTLPSMVPKVSKTPFYASAGILVALIIASIGLLIMNTTLSHSMDDVRKNINLKKGEIAQVSKDRNVVVARILSTNTIPMSLNLRSLIANFRDVAAKANVRLKGFSVSRDVISTSLIANEGNPNIHPDPASTIVTMMRAYMAANGDGKFTLDPIRSIGGEPNSRTTGITLRVVPTTSK